MSLLLICFDTLDTFGKEPEQLKNLEGAFQMVLGRFSIEQVEDAFRVYMEAKTTMPKPADIVKIIEPPVEPRKWCGATFIDIRRRQREGQFILDQELSYLKDFQAVKIKAPEQQRDLIENSESQIAIEDKRY